MIYFQKECSSMPFDLGKCLLKRHLKHRKLSQIELSHRTGISYDMINHYANNRKTMNLVSAKSIANALNVTIDDLYEFPWIPLSERE